MARIERQSAACDRGDKITLGEATYKVHEIEAEEEAGLGIRLGLHQ